MGGGRRAGDAGARGGAHADRLVLLVLLLHPRARDRRASTTSRRCAALRERVRCDYVHGRRRLPARHRRLARAEREIPARHALAGRAHPRRRLRRRHLAGAVPGAPRGAAVRGTPGLVAAQPRAAARAAPAGTRCGAAAARPTRSTPPIREVLEWLGELARTAVAAVGLPHPEARLPLRRRAARRSRRPATRPARRRCGAACRRSARAPGADAFLLGCGCPLGPAVGHRRRHAHRPRRGPVLDQLDQPLAAARTARRRHRARPAQHADPRLHAPPAVAERSRLPDGARQRDAS